MSNTLQTLTYRFTLNAFKNGVQRILQGWATGENLARKLEISLSAGQEAYELPMEGITASMYVTTPTTKTLSINACEIDYENNKIIYEVLPSDISEAGIVNMQLKIFDSAKILVSPSFGLDVWESTISDSQAVLSPTYTALTEALAEASAYSQKAISQVYVDEDYTFVIEFADGTEYTSTAFKDVIDSLVNGGEIAEGWARGTQEGVPVEEGSPYYHDNASYWSGQAHGYAGMAENAKGYAYQYANDALGYKNDASGYATTASGYVTDAHNEYLAAKSYAVGGTGTRTGEDNDNAKYYKERCEQIAASLEGGFVPMGTVLFANLPTSDIGEGWMYNVSDAFTSDNRFEDGGGIEYPAGTNVYYTAQGKWDCLSSPYQTAGNTAYDNSGSGYDATNMQDVIDEVITKKADKVSSAVNGNFAGLDASGNLTDSGKKAADFATDDEMSAVVNVYGSKNLNSYPYNETTKTENGITFTDNGDGTVFVGDVNNAQTTSADTEFMMHKRISTEKNPCILQNGNYIISGCPEGGSLTTYFLTIGYTNSSGQGKVIANDVGNGDTFTVNGGYYSDDYIYISLSITVKAGTTIPSGGYIFKPMIRDARISDDTYVPYAMTNKDLTENKVDKGGILKLISDNTAISVSANSTKTAAEIMTEVAGKLRTYVQGKDSNYRYQIKSCAIRLNGTGAHTYRNYRNDILDNSGMGSFTMQSQKIESSYIDLYDANFSADSASSTKYIRINTSGTISITDASSGIPTTGATSVNIIEYELV